MAQNTRTRPTHSVLPTRPPLLIPHPPAAPLIPPLHVVDLMTAEGSAAFAWPTSSFRLEDRFGSKLDLILPASSKPARVRFPILARSFRSRSHSLAILPAQPGFPKNNLERTGKFSTNEKRGLGDE